MYNLCWAYAELILSHTEYTRNEVHRMLSILGTDFIACWASAEMFKSRISLPIRIRFLKISCYRPLGPYGFGFCKKSIKKISCLCTFKPLSFSLILKSTYTANEAPVRKETVQPRYFQISILMVCLPIPTLIYLRDIYIFPQSVCLFAAANYVDQSWEYINRSQTHECRNWDCGRAIPFLGIHKLDFPYSVQSGGGTNMHVRMYNGIVIPT
jgi:hypothetical protein